MREVAAAGGVRVFELAPGVLARVADTVTPQPVLAVVGLAGLGLESLEGADAVVVCASVRDPGNAGTVVRCADAAGFGAVVFCDDSVDPYNPKAVRASAGSIVHVPVVVADRAADTLDALRGHGLRVLGAVARGGEDYARVDWRPPSAIVLGNEASGLSPQVVGALDGAVSVPMAGRAESLNVGMSCAVLCFELRRQRRLAPGGASSMPGMSGSGR